MRVVDSVTCQSVDLLDSSTERIDTKGVLWVEMIDIGGV